jgi:hypothetical protein
MSDEGDEAEAKELSRGLQAIRGVRFRGAAQIAPTGWVIEKEAPWHLSAAYMYAMGSCNREIAEAHGKSPQAVSNLFHQPFFQERVTDIMAENRRDIMDLFRGERISSLETLVAIRDNERAPAAARVACCREILDRTLGRPVQRVEAGGEVRSDDPVAEVERLEREINRLKEEV